VNDRLSKIASENEAQTAQLNQSRGIFYIVATPIGNLKDISFRALEILKSATLVLAEDTRHSKRLFNHYGITTKLRACHQHNEVELVQWVSRQLSEGKDLALISDAGTPLISDPGFVLVRALRQQKFQVHAIPGPSSVIAALSVAGLATDRFLFDGFLPNKSAARKTQLADYLEQTRTIVLLESSHRIVVSVADISEVLGPDRRVVIARELTKKFETVLDGRADEISRVLSEDPDQTRGEFVVMIEGAIAQTEDQSDLRSLLKVLLAELSLKQASKLAAKITGAKKNDAYEVALSLKDSDSSDA
jgi:16S rRNA (cytidine1402-2'-O)-methyltransferase